MYEDKHSAVTGVDTKLRNRLTGGIHLQYPPETVQDLIDNRSCYGAPTSGVLHLMCILPVKPDGCFSVLNCHLELQSIAVAIRQLRRNSITDTVCRNTCSPPECFCQNCALLFKLCSVTDMLPMAPAAPAKD
jgi:hypothetical protein